MLKSQLQVRSRIGVHSDVVSINIFYFVGTTPGRRAGTTEKDPRGIGEGTSTETGGRAETARGRGNSQTVFEWTADMLVIC